MAEADRTHIRAGRQRVLASLVAAAEADLRQVGASGVNVTLAAHGQLVQLAYSSGVLARDLYEIQRTLGEGPTLVAVARGVPIVATLTDDTHDRWIAFGRAARAHGIDRVYAIPQGTGGVRIGALTVHVGPTGRVGADRADSADPAGGAQLASSAPTDTPAPPGDAQLAGLLRLADRLLLALLAPPNAPADAARTGVFTTVTHQAAGMVSVQLGIPIADAVVTLQAEAFGSGRDLVAVSRDVVTRRLRFDPDDTPDEERGTLDDH